jgi:hypothetical protein
MPNDRELRRKLEEAGTEMRRFEPGDALTYRLREASGHKSTKADEGGFEIWIGQEFMAVTDSMLEEAMAAPRPEFPVYEKHEPEPLEELPLPPQKIYHCNCPGLEYDNYAYARWLRKSMKDTEGTLPPDGYPDVWKGGWCTRCNSIIMSKVP